MDVQWLGTVAYDEAWELQRRLHSEVATGTRDNTVLLLEHESVFTAGRRTQPQDRPADPAARVVEVDRGGRITWHGPGQLVGYPILRLRDPIDVVAHVRRIEDVLCKTTAELGLIADRVDGRSGLWVEGVRKVAAIGVRVSQGVTMHGFALNCDCELSSYDPIVPCGITDAGVTSLSAELARRVTTDDARAVLAGHLGALSP